MPNISGLRILEKIKSTPSLSTLPVIVVSGRDDPKTVKAAKDLGAFDFISKPFEPMTLLASIKHSLGGSQ
jgi:DNA-binding response OmpR family regulator